LIIGSYCISWKDLCCKHWFIKGNNWESVEDKSLFTKSSCY